MTDAPPPLVSLADGWSLWPLFELRGAGFDVERLAPMHDAQVAAAVARRPTLVDAVSAARGKALGALSAWKRQAGVDAAVANRAMNDLRRGVRGVATGHDAADGALRTLDGARDALAALDAELGALYAALEARADAALRATVSSEDFRRALMWQNRRALNGGMDAWLRSAVGTDDHAARKTAASVMIYLQRYCTKNDTVGFFGPVGWGTFSDVTAPVTQHPGAALVDTTALRLEPWAAAALADALSAEAFERLVPTLSTRVRLDGNELHGVPGRSLRGTRVLPAAVVEMLGRVDGKRTVAELGEAQRTLVENLLAQSIVRARLTVTANARPHASLPQQIHDVGGDEGGWQRFADAWQQVEARVQEPAVLGEALEKLDTTFHELTSRDATRNAGQTYGSRTLFYVNCRRDHALEIGAPVVETLKAPLSLLLQGARWFTHRVARGFLGELLRVHQALSRTLNSGRVPMVHVYNRLVPLFENPPPRFIRDARDELETHWSTVLALPDLAARQVDLRSADLHARAATVFNAPHPGMPSARHHCPDVLLSRNDDGTWRVVLGEIHAGVNTLAVLQAVDMSRNPDQLRALYRRDLPPPIISELQHDDYSLCAHDSLLDARDWHLDTGSRYASWLPPERTLRLSDFDLVEEDGFLRCVSVDGEKRFDSLQVLERMVRLNATTEFHLPVAAPHQPRVTVDGVVIIREAWRLSAEEIKPILDSDGVERLQAAHALRQKRALSRRLFVRVASEHKPLYLDLESPSSLAVFARVARQADQVRASEMLPTPEEAWLQDAQARRYVSEFRMVAVDPEMARPIPVAEAVS